MGARPTVFWNRAEKREETELVFGEKAMRWLYETPSGHKLVNGFLTHRLPSIFYGIYQSSFLSKRAVAPFIREFKIPMEEFDEGPFDSFNDFFTRRFKPGKRAFVDDAKTMPAFAEGRYLAFESIGPGVKYPVKGSYLSAEAILGHVNSTEAFIGGPMLIARLCPTDYHRFHFPDFGEVEQKYGISGRLHSVSPLALRFRGDILATNERQISILKTRNFGKLAYIEVGALCVGRIEETYDGRRPFKRGEEKGYFLFGGSTVILMGQRGAWSPDSDLLLETSQHSRETLVRLGEPVAHAR